MSLPSTQAEEWRRLQTDLNYFYDKFFSSPHEPHLWDYQKKISEDLLNPAWQEYALLKGRQLGMSWFMGFVVCHFAIMHDNVSVILVSFNLEQAQHILNYAKSHLAKLKSMGLYDAFVDGASMKVIRLNNGSKITALGCTRPDANNVRGFVAHLLVVDEAAFIYDKMFASILPTTSNTRGKTIYLSTAGSIGSHFYRVWDEGNKAEKWKRQLDAGHDLSITYDDVPKVKSYNIPSTEVLDQEELDRARRQLGDMKYMREYMCQWAGSADQVFKHIPIFAERRMPTKTEKPCFAGIDVGKVSDPTVLVVIEAYHSEGDMLNRDGIKEKVEIPYRIIYIKSWEGGESMTAIANDIKRNIVGRFPVRLFSVDATAGYGDLLIQEMVKLELPTRGKKVTTQEKNVLMLGSPAQTGLADAFNEEQLWVNSDPNDGEAYELLFELNAYTGKVNASGLYTFDSTVDRDHSVDASAHAWSSVQAGTFEPLLITRKRK